MRVHHLASIRRTAPSWSCSPPTDAARILDAAGTDLLLVGDSIGNVMLGHISTPGGLDGWWPPARWQATKRALVVADLPFGGVRGRSGAGTGQRGASHEGGPAPSSSRAAPQAASVGH